MRGKSATSDEVSHLPAGYSYLRTGLIKINPQHPPLVKELCAFPLLFLNVKAPFDRERLQNIEIAPTFEWRYGRLFLYSQDAGRILFWGRVPAVLLSLGLAALVMVWAERLWGREAGLLALFLYAFDPTITAHAQLVTTDVGLAFFATLFLFILRKYLESPLRKTLVLCGISLGLALGAKFSALFLLPIAFFLMVFAAWYGEAWRGDNPARRMKTAIAAFAFMVIMAGFTLWAIYLFPLDPLFYIKGLQAVNRDHNPHHLFYLMGQLKEGGWKIYFLIAWLIKTPIPSLLLLSAAAVLFALGRRVSGLDEAFLIVPGLVFFAGYSLAADNLGVRYLIPCFPFFFIFTARVASGLMAAKRRVVAAIAILMGWYLIEFASIFPDHLSYFNEFAGGYRGGIEWLDDSNVDWGQGLIQLRDYLQEHPIRDYWFCYFGGGGPEYYGIPSENTHTPVFLSSPPGSKLILSAHCVARERAWLAGHGTAEKKNWLADLTPRAIVGHAYYIYEIPSS